MNDVEYALHLQDRKRAAKESMKACSSAMNGNMNLNMNIVGAAKNVKLPGDEYEQEKARLLRLSQNK
jgi:hypothetical protein